MGPGLTPGRLVLLVHVHHHVQDGVLAATQPLGPAQRGIEELLPLDQSRSRPCLPRRSWIRVLTSAAATPQRAHLSRSTRNSRFDWPLMLKTPTSWMPRMPRRMFLTWWPALPPVQVGAEILTELSPLTPARASVTLSRMYCEKFQSTPTILPVARRSSGPPARPWSYAGFCQTGNAASWSPRCRPATPVAV